MCHFRLTIRPAIVPTVSVPWPTCRVTVRAVSSGSATRMLPRARSHILEGGLIAGHHHRGGDVADQFHVVAVAAVVVDVEGDTADLQRCALGQSGEGAGDGVGAVVLDDHEALARVGAESERRRPAWPR